MPTTGRKVGFSNPIFAGAKIVDVTTSLTNVSGGSVSTTITDARIVGSMQLVSLELGNPEAVGANISFHPAFGELTISCDYIEGTTTLKAYFQKIVDDPTTITSSEYDILNNKIELIKNVDVNFPVTIETTDWTLDTDTGEYVYTWTNNAVTTECSVDVQFVESQDDADVDFIGSEKVTGGIKFSVDYVPSVDIPVNIKITNTRPKAIEEITAEMVATEAVSGAANVEEALEEIDNRLTWKYHNQTTGTTAIDLPSVFNELFVKVYTTGDQTNVFSGFIPKIALTDNYLWFHLGGGYYASSYPGWSARVEAKNTSIKIKQIMNHGSDVSSSANLVVYYR